MLLCEAAAYYKSIGKSLIDVLNEIYKEFGYYREKQISLVLEGIEGQERISRMMKVYRNEFPKVIGESKLASYTDLDEGKDYDLFTGKETENIIGKSNVLKFMLEDGSWYAVRPSGTEPKIKIYIYTKSNTLEKPEEKIKVIEEIVMGKLNSVE
ncbi:Phosphoglucomutase [bioreactor metagenome]|uniref:Phosphoglucomutase n=1 Tax=bioreactor metagenome TaxID=1076179 RepID=A0A645DI74_9ZZZZ